MDEKISKKLLNELSKNFGKIKEEDLIVKISECCNMSLEESRKQVKNYKKFIETMEKDKNELNKFSETSLNRIMKHGESGFIVISTNRSLFNGMIPDNLQEDYHLYLLKNDIDDSEKERKKFISERNNKCDKELLSELRSLNNKFSFTPVFGGYKREDHTSDVYEPSFIVYSKNKKGETVDFNELKSKAIEWCKKYKQDSVYVQEPNEAPCYLDENGNNVNETSSLNFKFNRNEEEFFTTTDRDKKASRFTADIKFPKFMENMRLRDYPTSYPEKVKFISYGEFWDLFD